MTVRDYRRGDVYRVPIRAGDVTGSNLENFNGPAITLYDDERPIAVCGVQEVSLGVGMLWSYISDGVRQGHGRPLIRLARRMMPITAQEMGLQRIQATSLAEKDEYARFLRAIGFEFEGCLRQAAPDKRDLNMFARIF